MIRTFIQKNKLILILIAVFIVAEIIVNPIADFPLNDDWCYAKSVKYLLETGKIDTIDSQASVWTHIVLGWIFAKLFGFSFIVLRFSTLISAVLSVFLLNKMIITISENRVASVVSCAVFLFNPIYFNLANTFMSDVNFITLLIASVLAGILFLQSEKPVYLIGFFCFSTLLVLLRQLGIIVPFCFIIACTLLQKRKWLYTFVAVVIALSIFFILKYYESYLKTVLPSTAAYKYSSDSNFKDEQFWRKLFSQLWPRMQYILLASFVFSFPFVIILMRNVFRNFNKVIVIETAALMVCMSYLLFRNCSLISGNILNYGGVGPESFYEVFSPQYDRNETHNFISLMPIAMDSIKVIFPAGTLTCICFWIISLCKVKRSFFVPDKRVIFLLCLYFSYMLMLFITHDIFDRYVLPNILFMMILLAFMARGYESRFKAAMAPLLLSFYVAVLGTKDYLELNRKRWEAYHYIIDELGVDHSLINGGYEVNAWYEGKPTRSSYFTDLYVYEYLIQFGQEPGFSKIKEFEFQRYFPYKKDRIYIFKNRHRRGAS